MRLSGKTAIITGAASGIGLAAAQIFSKEGAKVMLVDLSENALENAVQGLENAEYCVADVSKADQVQNFVIQTLAKFGRIDALFCNAGVAGENNFFWDCPEEKLDSVMNVNFKGVWRCMKAVVPTMIQQKSGSIIITSSVLGLSGLPKGFAYSSSKHAVVGLAKSAAGELGRLNIRVNTIHPGPVETPMVRSLETGISPKDGALGKDRLEKSIPMRRYATPEEVAKLALFLASDDSAYITGSEHRIDGGMRAV
ncbi:MAG: SDR family oxidoreductase [Bacteroidetes bacterium]|nr:MAG: SDR family oxidoreductase [Bacteroidota bacterium]